MEDIIREAATIDRIALHGDLGIYQLDRVHILKMFFARLAGQNDFDIVRALHIRKQLVPSVLHHNAATFPLGIPAPQFSLAAKFQIAERLFHIGHYEFQFHKVFLTFRYWLIDFTA